MSSSEVTSKSTKAELWAEVKALRRKVKRLEDSVAKYKAISKLKAKSKTKP